MTARWWALRALASAAVAAALVRGVLAQAPAAKPAALVNGEPIHLAEVEAILKLRPTPFLKPTDEEHREMQREVLDMLIDDLVLQQFLRKNAPPVPPAEVNKKLNELQAALKTQGRTLDDFCRENGQTEAQVRANVLTMLQRNAYVAAHISDAVVQKYYADNREFFDQVNVRASHILLRLPPGSTPEESQAARARLAALRQEIVSGKLDFAEAARNYSQCPSAPGGGDVGYFPRKGDVEEPFAEAAFALNKGEVSDVVQTSYGLHLIKVTDRKAARLSDFKTMEEKVRAFAAEEMLLQIQQQQRQAARVEVYLGEEPPAKATPTARRSLFGGR
jgi:peptidyl-prolyl cis-trans isomerase C